MARKIEVRDGVVTDPGTGQALDPSGGFRAPVGADPFGGGATPAFQEKLQEALAQQQGIQTQEQVQQQEDKEKNIFQRIWDFGKKGREEEAMQREAARVEFAGLSPSQQIARGVRAAGTLILGAFGLHYLGVGLATLKVGSATQLTLTGGVASSVATKSAIGSSMKTLGYGLAAVYLGKEVLSDVAFSGFVGVEEAIQNIGFAASTASRVKDPVLRGELMRDAYAIEIKERALAAVEAQTTDAEDRTAYLAEKEVIDKHLSLIPPLILVPLLLKQYLQQNLYFV